MDFLQIEVSPREKLGSGQSQRMRRDGQVPAVLYGLKKNALSLTVGLRDLDKFLRTGNRLVELKMSGDTRTAILREIQWDPVTDEILHVDFLRVDKNQEIDDSVPIVFRGRAKGAAEGGVFQGLRSTLDVRCKPADLPKEIVLDVDHLGVHQSIHAGEVKLPAGVTLRGNPHVVLCVVAVVKVEAAPATPAEGAPTEPELIGRAAKDEEAAEGEVAEGKGKADAKPAAEKKPDAKKDEKKK
jgi:large subunit ribosomal protein L25